MSYTHAKFVDEKPRPALPVRKHWVTAARHNAFRRLRVMRLLESLAKRKGGLVAKGHSTALTDAAIMTARDMAVDCDVPHEQIREILTGRHLTLSAIVATLVL